LIGPLVTGGAGVAVLTAGLVMGAVMKGTQSDYAKLPVTNKTQAQTASDKLSTGRGQAVVADVLLGVGAAALVAGGIWLAIELGQHGGSEERAALAPMLAPGTMGLVLVGREHAL
jgi:hypothetical protein